MWVSELIEAALAERQLALDTRDPLAMRRAGERYRVILKAVESMPAPSRVDPRQVEIPLNQAAYALGLKTHEARRLALQRGLPVTGSGRQARLPLAILF